MMSKENRQELCGGEAEDKSDDDTERRQNEDRSKTMTMMQKEVQKKIQVKKQHLANPLALWNGLELGLETVNVVASITHIAQHHALIILS